MTRKELLAMTRATDADLARVQNELWRDLQQDPYDVRDHGPDGRWAMVHAISTERPLRQQADAAEARGKRNDR